MVKKLNCGWAGTISEFLGSSEDSVLNHLIAMQCNNGNNQSQVKAWKDCIKQLKITLQQYLYSEDYIIFEYIIPRSALSRPDVLIIQRRKIVCLKVLEFKSYPKLMDSEKWQLRLYLKKLKLYHKICYQRNIRIDGLLISTSVQKADMNYIDEKDQIKILGMNHVLEHLHVSETDIDLEHTTNLLDTFLEAKYKPSPAITQSARILFQERDIPKISTIESTNFSQVLTAVEQIVFQAYLESSHHLVLVHGEPGAGKTFLGLSIAHSKYQETDVDDGIVYLSGNEPLVEVLANLTDERFVQHLYKYKGDYKTSENKPGTMPEEQIIIFDEAQRAWDQKKVAYQGLSEPDIILDIATQRNKRWSVTIALIGHGQEIKGGEEGGLILWAEAVKRINQKNDVQIIVHGSKDLQVFDGYDLEKNNFTKNQDLYLNSSLRHHDAQQYHEFVNAFLAGDMGLARVKYRAIQADYLLAYTDNIHLAKQHFNSYAENIIDGQFQCGAVYSSTSKLTHFKEFEYNSKLDDIKTYVAYYNYPQLLKKRRDSFEKYPGRKNFYSNMLIYAVSEYQCQGLELDMVLLEWGDDLIWENNKWHVNEYSSKHKDTHSKDAYKLILNTYRVLLTRGRDATVIHTQNKAMLQLFEDLGVRKLQ